MDKDRAGSGLSRRSFLIRLGAFAGALPLAAACSAPAAQAPAQPAQQAPAKPAELKKLTIAVGADPAFLHYVAAAKKGLMEPYGIQSDFKSFDDGNVALDALLTGNSDIGATSELGGLVRRAKGGRLYILGSGAQSTSQIGILTKGETVKVPKDIEGKKVGVTIGSGGHYFFARYLKKHAIDQSKLTVVNIQAPEMVAAFNRGDIDVAFTWNPWIPKALASIPGTKHFARSGDDDVFTLNMYIYVSQRLIDDPELGVSALKGIVDGANWIRNPANLEEGARISSEAINVPVDDAKNYISNVFNFDVKWFPQIRTNIEEAAQFAREIKIIDNVPNMDEFIRPEFMQKAAPDRVKA